MPINLELTDAWHDLKDVRSTLFVLCPVCPQFSLAMQPDSPWIELRRSGLKTGALEDHIRSCRTVSRRGQLNFPPITPMG
jgi:hypothetical protein